ncbi:arylsulfatase J-like [Stegodyphus dumicola]|uniref:arylsulfatase J-like n=1 Tax=Stegodyphus dumicola TaxID=202533 RepID=UPI0015AF5193|nr:arylsulfatase J-like [Stegodyphus dumicola]XP_035224043.1 arylsulfatase J-like [Stegodyphus dumicola]XP_035224044.1 arylsulfatase J-like [Stegodyphus dumicola]
MQNLMKLSTLFLLILLVQRICSKSPHIIFILIDDLGWNDVSFHGSKQIPTPNIDTLAYSGVILNNYYVQPLCTPSRGTLMTGKYPIRLGLQHDVIYAEGPWGLSPSETILPQYLKQLGYVTRGIGKWHLGHFREDYLPVNRGFDSFFGYWTGKGDLYTHSEEGEGTCGLDFHDDNENVWDYTGQYATNVYTKKAEDIIRSHNSSKPLFLYLAHQAVHAGNSYAPLQAPPEYVEIFTHIKDADRRNFAGMVSSLDNSVGELFSELDKANMLKDTVLIFTTDNGAAVEGIDQSSGSNWPLRGSKYNMWEGGIRGTAFVWSPLLEKTDGIVSTHMMHMSDWLPTLYSLAGGDVKNLGDIDGFDMWPTICCNTTSAREVILHNIDPEWKVEAIRKGKYKLLKGSVFNGNFDGWFDKEGKKKENIPFAENDIMVQRKIYKKFAQESKVRAIISKYQQSSVSRHTGSMTDSYCMMEDHNSDSFSEESGISDNVQDSGIYDSNEDCGSDICDDGISGEDSVISDSISILSHNQEISRSPLEVYCGVKPENASTNCKPMDSACLFNLEEDPCEYNNLAYSLPSVVKELEILLDMYRSYSVPIRNRPLDPAANPKYYGYAWVPWKSLSTRFHENCLH